MLRHQLESEDYFQSTLFNAFLFRERHLVNEIKNDFRQRKSHYYLLNQFIESDAKIIHHANDFGQTDMLLILNEAKRKIYSFIKEEQKRNIAKQNFIVKRRNIYYMDNFETDETFDTLLISHAISTEHFPAHLFNKIIFFHTPVMVLSNYQNTFSNEYLSVWELTKPPHP